jgi:tRNA-specific 2-thiouridylase
VGKVNFSDFLKTHIPSQKWEIRDTAWKNIGEHDGAFQYTIGQRKGIAVGGGPALFVLEKDVQNNVIIVWTEDDKNLFKKTCRLTAVNCLFEASLPLECEAQIRYRQAPQKCRISQKDESLVVEFLEPQRAISPGQVCALYDGERVLWSGIITL